MIGGGVTGVSTAFHPTRRGICDVVIVDEDALASGGTGKSSGCVRQHYSTAETCRMIRYSLELFQHFAEQVDGESSTDVIALARHAADRVWRPCFLMLAVAVTSVTNERASAAVSPKAPGAAVLRGRRRRDLGSLAVRAQPDRRARRPQPRAAGDVG